MRVLISSIAFCLQWTGLPSSLSEEVRGQLKSPPMIIFSPEKGSKTSGKFLKNVICCAESLARKC